MHSGILNTQLFNSHTACLCELAGSSSKASNENPLVSAGAECFQVRCHYWNPMPLLRSNHLHEQLNTTKAIITLNLQDCIYKWEVIDDRGKSIGCTVSLFAILTVLVLPMKCGAASDWPPNNPASRSVPSADRSHSQTVQSRSHDFCRRNPAQLQKPEMTIRYWAQSRKLYYKTQIILNGSKDLKQQRGRKT